jgi:hypothetical protein
VSYKDQVKRGGLDSSAGFLVKNPQAPHRTTMPSWDKGETQFRVFPAPREGGWHPMRESLDDDDFGPAVWAERVARRLGVREQLTFCTRIPGAQTNPTEQFVPALHALIKEKPREVPAGWTEWIQGGHNRGAKLPDKIKSCLFFQGAEVMRQGKALTNAARQPAPQFPALLMATVSAQMSFERCCNMRSPKTEVEAAVMAETAGILAPISTIDAAAALAQIQGADDNARAQQDAVYAQAFAMGDWCSINGGRVLRIFQAPPKQDERPHYSVVTGAVMDFTPIADRIRAGLWWPWEKLLKFHTAEEQIRLLCRAFPAEAVDYVFGSSEYSDFLPPQVRGAWGRYRSGQTAAVPGTQVAPPPVAPAPAAVAPAPAAAAPAPAAVAPAPAAVAPAPAPAAPAPAPAAPALDLSGGGGSTAAPPSSPSGVGSPGYGQPAEFSQPPAAAAPAAPAPAAPAPAPSPTGTPAAAVTGGDVNEAALDAAVADLNSARSAQAGQTQAPPSQVPPDEDIPF